MEYFLTIDNGGTNTKAVICDAFGHQVGLASFSTKRIETQPGFQEIDLTTLLNDLGQAIKNSLKKAQLSGDQISAVTVVGHGKGLYPISKSGDIFMHGILSTDSRAQDLASEFSKNITQIYDISHQQIMTSQAPLILRWLKDNARKQYDQIGFVLSNKDFIRYLLTGEIKQEIGDASGNNLINLETKDYDSRLTDFFGIEEIAMKLPPLIQATDIAGKITADAATVTGLKIGTPVYGGMFDIDACTIATGVLSSDLFSVVAGTWSINVFLSSQFAPIKSGLMSSLFPTGEGLIEASSPTSAGNLAMIIKMLLKEESENAKAQNHTIYDNLEDMLTQTDARYTSVLFFPFLYGSNVDPDAEGAFIGIRSLTTKMEMIRAVYEGICFAHRAHVEKLIKVAGKRPKAIRLSGGACNSKHWVQMFADVLNLPVELVDESELGGLGGAITCAVGSGLYPDFPTAVERMSRVVARFEPNPDQVALYEQKYEVYSSILDSLDGKWNKIRLMQKEVNLSK